MKSRISRDKMHAHVFASPSSAEELRRDEWKYLLCLFNISRFSFTVCSETMEKRSQHDSGEERVTTKFRPMMNLIARAPSHVSSSTSVSLVWSGRPDIGIDRLKASDYNYREQFMESFSAAIYSKWDDDRAWFSQEWKTDLEMYDRLGRPDQTFWRTTREFDLVSLTSKFFMTEPRNTLWMRKFLVTDWSDPISIIKEEQGLNNSTLGMMKQNWNCQ